jgi:hypothetical protein
MKFSPRTSHPRSETCKSFRRTLLRRPLHKFSALASVTWFDGITHRGNDSKTRKSFRRLLLPLFVPVSAVFASRESVRDPLGAHSYKKMGWYPLPCAGIMAKSLCYVPLTRFQQNASKIIQCFLSLTGTQTCKSLCYVPLTENAGGGGIRVLSLAERKAGWGGRVLIPQSQRME